ncbi:hypothetical protein LTR94_025130 [Friedmanniomyces endolithicus]|nr:hypothetical protein LTR94_025130 [Friedmanniomyces endolithicus]
MSQTRASERLEDDVTHTVARLLRRLADDGADRGLTLDEIRDRLDERSYGLLILILAIPCLVPGLYGVPQVVGLIIILLAVQLLAGRQEPWLPRWMLKLRAKPGWLAAMADFSEKRLAWLDRLSKPRLTALVDGPGERLCALVMILAASTIVLPLTNTIPSIALALTAVGLIQRDGVFAALGGLVTLLWLIALAIVTTGLVTGAQWAQQWSPGG